MVLKFVKVFFRFSFKFGYNSSSHTVFSAAQGAEWAEHAEDRLLNIVGEEQLAKRLLIADGDLCKKV